MSPKHMVAAMIAFVAAMLLMGPCNALMNSGDSVAVDETSDRSSTATINAFALGYFAGLTVGVSDVVLGGLMTRGEREQARTDRVQHHDADVFGKMLGFATLAFFGWRLIRRPKSDT